MGYPKRPKIDRGACPRLISRFIEQEPEFFYGPSDRVLTVAQQTGAIPYDIAGVELSHVGALCTFDAAPWNRPQDALYAWCAWLRGETQSWPPPLRRDLTPPDGTGGFPCPMECDEPISSGAQGLSPGLPQLRA